MTGPQLLKTYGTGNELTETFADLFGYEPLLCLGQSDSCRVFCSTKCHSPWQSEQCKACEPHCRYIAPKACKYAYLPMLLTKLYASVKKKPENCRNDKRTCKAQCKARCKHTPNSDTCKQCNKYCHMALEPACTWGNHFTQKYSNLQHKTDMNPHYASIFRLNKYKCANKSHICAHECEDKCLVNEAGTACTRCTDSCSHAADDVCRKEQIDPDGITNFNHFLSNHNKCNEIDEACIAQCKYKCPQEAKFADECLRCGKTCHLAAKAACEVQERTIQRHKGLYGELAEYFSKKKPVKCDQCDSEMTFVCDWKCGENYRCNDSCNILAKTACMSNCTKGYKTYYEDKFEHKFDEDMKKHPIVCKQCSLACNRSCANQCFADDKRCLRQCKHICKMACSHHNCLSEKNYLNKLAYSKKNTMEYIKKVIEVEMGRFEAIQSLRDEYEDMKDVRMRQAIYRENRDNVMDTIEITEADLYDEQEELMNEQEKKARLFEMQVKNQIKTIYTNRNNYEKTKESEMAIFED